MGNINRVLSYFENKPQLIEPKTANTILEFLELRNSKGVETNKSKPEAFTKKHFDYKKNIEGKRVSKKTAIMNIEGPLTYKKTGWEALCGGCSYQAIHEGVAQAIEDGIEHIVMNVDSGGGEAYGAFETAKEIRKMCDNEGVKLTAYVDGLSASAAYALSCVCDEVIANNYAEVGSIGVVTRLVNSTEAQEKAGYKTTYIYAGGNKIPYDTDGGFRDEFLKDIQAKVDNLYDAFVSHVAEARGMDEESVRNTDAKVFTAIEAKEKGLVDKIMSKDEFLNYIMEEDGMSAKKQGETPVAEAEEQKKVEMADTGIDAKAIKELMAQNEQLRKMNAEFSEKLNKIEEQKKAEYKQMVQDAVNGYSFLTEESKTGLTSFLMSNNDAVCVINALNEASNALAAAVEEEKGHGAESSTTGPEDAMTAALKNVLKK